jgi:hypothetical protein
VQQTAFPTFLYAGDAIWDVLPTLLQYMPPSLAEQITASRNDKTPTDISAMSGTTDYGYGGYDGYGYGALDKSNKVSKADKEKKMKRRRRK